MALELVYSAPEVETVPSGCMAGPEFWFPFGGVQTGEAMLGVRFVCSHCGRFGVGAMDRARLLPVIAAKAEADFFAVHGASCPWGGALAEEPIDDLIGV